MIRLVSVFVLIFFLAGCKNAIEHKVIKKDKFYFLRFARNRMDTIKLDSFLMAYGSYFKPIDSICVSLKNKTITIIKLSNEPAPIDGGGIKFWEKNVGLFYEKSTTWYSFVRLSSTNDSINQYISTLMGFVLLYPNMTRDSHYEASLKFVPLKIKE